MNSKFIDGEMGSSNAKIIQCIQSMFLNRTV
jgi:hypothetical protein